MRVVVVTAEMCDRLLPLSGEAELRDEAGHVLGRFVPSHAFGLDLSPEEVAKLLAPGQKTHRTAEVLAYVKGLVS